MHLASYALYRVGITYDASLCLLKHLVSCPMHSFLWLCWQPHVLIIMQPAFFNIGLCILHFLLWVSFAVDLHEMSIMFLVVWLRCMHDSLEHNKKCDCHIIWWYVLWTKCLDISIQIYPHGNPHIMMNTACSLCCILFSHSPNIPAKYVMYYTVTLVESQLLV